MPNSTDIQQLLINEANRIGPDIYRKTLNTSPWLKLVKKDTWPDEMGDSIKVLTYERSLPVNALSWSSVSLNPVTSQGQPAFSNGTSVGSGDTSVNAIPQATQIQFAQTLRAYNLTQTALESPRISVNDLRFSLKRKEQLSNIFAILQENTSYAWQDRFRDEYTRLAQNKINVAVDGQGKLIANSGEASAFSLTTPTSGLVQGVLDRVYMKLIRDGAGNNPLDRENARPVFGAILSSEASRKLIAENADIRQDYRWSSKVNELLAPLGIERSYAGFFHMVDDWLPRHDAYALDSAASAGATVVVLDGGADTLRVGLPVSGEGVAAGTVVTGIDGAEVGLSLPLVANVAGGAKLYFRRLPYKAVQTTQGSKWDIDPAYETAEFEDTIIFHQDVFTNLVPKPITAAGSNVTFDAVSYMGDFKWKNILNEVTNPDGTLGYFRAILSSGSKPIRPEWGYVIRHKRATTPLALDETINI
jgi:hypothetical protein